MQSAVAPGFLSAEDAGRAREIVRGCVHCGMCAAACPTYILDGDERDSPRGRIYLINEMLRNGAPSAAALRHLDRCLTCRACETACPSGVRYGELADIGRAAAEPARRPLSRILRGGAAAMFANSAAMAAAGAMMAAAAKMRAPFLSEGLRRHFRRRRRAIMRAHRRGIICPPGCVEGALSPQTHAALSDVLDAAEIGLRDSPGGGCCGALRFHLNQQEQAKKEMRRNVAAWAPRIKSGAAEAIVMTSSGCLQMVARYGELLDSDDARLVSARTMNAARIVGDEWERIAPRLHAPPAAAVSYHSPCTMQNGPPADESVEKILAAAGYAAAAPAEKTVCCGSAGAYSVLQPSRARRLRDRKLQNLAAAGDGRMATANIGCQLHLSAGSARPVLHWLELLAEAIRPELRETAQC